MSKRTPDWDSPHIRSVNPDARDRVPWYDSTPGFAPSHRRGKIPVGATVRVIDGQYLPSQSGPGWIGRITSHMIWMDGSYTGLSTAECLDPGAVLNKVTGRCYQVELVHCHVIDASQADV